MKYAAAVVLLAAMPLVSGCASTNPAKAAMDSGDMTLFRAVLDGPVDYDATVYAFNLNLMEYAACKGKNQAILEMLAHGANVNKGHEVSHAYGVPYTPLSRAIGCNGSNTHPSTVKLLLDHGAQVDKMSLVMISQNYNDESIVDMVHAAYARQHGEQAEVAESPAPAAAPAPRPAAVSADVDAPTHRAASRPDDFALVIGIEKYSRLPEARYAENDADAMKKHLLALGYPERNIILLKGGQATRGALQGYVEEWLPRNAKPGSQVFFYFSGHGSPDPKTGDAYIVPWDGDAMFLKSTAYPLKGLYASLGRLKAKRVLVALDSCFSGAGGRSVLASGARPLVSHVDETHAPAGVTALSAASGDEITATIDVQGHGAFTYYLLKAFNDGKLTAKAAYDELKPRVQDEAHRQNREQTPLMLGDDAPF